MLSSKMANVFSKYSIFLQMQILAVLINTASCFSWSDRLTHIILESICQKPKPKAVTTAGL